MIAAELLTEVAAVVRNPGPEAVLEGELRRRWPSLRFTLCSDDDVPARLAPVLEEAAFNLYLIGGGEHCLALTTDPTTAIGVLVAWREPDGT
jgi:hypothetical protein